MSGPLRAEYQRAKDYGWLPHFLEAAAAFDLRADVLMGIASRESFMGGREIAPDVFEWLTKPGDKGNGFGLMQIDKRSFPAWVQSGAWRRAEDGILKGAEVLAAKRDGLFRRAGQTVSVRDSTTKLRYRFVMPTFTAVGMERAALASYNSGDWAGYHASKGRDVDRGTYGGDYSKDVLARAEHFRNWLVADGLLVMPETAA